VSGLPFFDPSILGPILAPSAGRIARGLAGELGVAGREPDVPEQLEFFDRDDELQRLEDLAALRDLDGLVCSSSREAFFSDDIHDDVRESPACCRWCELGLPCGGGG